MCQATNPIPTLVDAKAITFGLQESNGCRQMLPVKVDHVQDVDNSDTTPSIEGETKTLLLPSILRKSSYVTKTSTLKRAKRCHSVPGLIAAEEEEDSTGFSRASSIKSIQSSDDVKCLVGEDYECNELQDCSRRAVSFDGRVLVQEFSRLPGEHERTWYTEQELRGFLLAVLRLNKDYDRQHYWGRGFFSPAPPSHTVMHSHPALVVNDDDKDDEPTIQGEIKRILIVDSHDMSLRLFAKSFQMAFPHATITTAKTGQDALNRCLDGVSFDIILVEERLSLFHHQTSHSAGSGFLQALHQNHCQRNSLKIGVSAHVDHDQAALMESGADFCWSKPPPPLNKATVEEIFQALVGKRGKA